MHSIYMKKYQFLNKWKKVIGRTYWSSVIPKIVILQIYAFIIIRWCSSTYFSPRIVKRGSSSLQYTQRWCLYMMLDKYWKKLKMNFTLMGINICTTKSIIFFWRLLIWYNYLDILRKFYFFKDISLLGR